MLMFESKLISPEKHKMNFNIMIRNRKPFQKLLLLASYSGDRRNICPIERISDDTEKRMMVATATMENRR